VLNYDRVKRATKLTGEEIAAYLAAITSLDATALVVPGPAPRIVPRYIDDDSVLHTATIGKANILHVKSGFLSFRGA
jgi:hypothetical protein